MIKSVERQVAEATIQALLTAGFNISIYNGDEDGDFEVEHLTDKDEILNNMAAADIDQLCVYEPGRETYTGWVKLVYGNDKDLISDYTTNLEDVLKPVFEAIEQYEIRKGV